LTPRCAPKLCGSKKVNKKEIISYRTIQSAQDGDMRHFSIPRKPRPEGRMNALTQAQKDAAFAWCETASIRQGVLWIKEQFNLRVSRAALGRWLREQRIANSMAPEIARLRENQDRAAVIGEVAGTATTITVANSVLFSQAVFEEFSKPEPQRNQKLMVHYMELALAAREQELKGNAIALAFSRFHFDAAKTALKQAAALQSINRSRADDRAKIDRAVVLLFGKPPQMPELDLPQFPEPPPSTSPEP
jgi:hypothetical protein